MPQILILMMWEVYLVMGSKIDAVFAWAKKKEITFVEEDANKPGKKNNSTRSWNDYCSKVHTYEKWLQEEKGLKDITRAKPRHAQEYIDLMIQKRENGVRGGSPSTINSFIHSLHAFSQLAKESKIYRPMQLGKKEKLLEYKNDAGILRKSSESTCLMATPSEFSRVISEIERSKSPQKQLVKEVQQIQRGVGCRISEVIGMKKEHIEYRSDGTASVYIKGKGGLERWVEVRDKDTIQLLKDKTEDKKEGTFVVEVKDRQGNDKSHEASVKLVQSVIDKAVDRAGVERDGARYSSHSARKVYAQEQVDKYSKMSEKQLRNELARRISNYPLGKGGHNKLKEKYESVVQEVRNKIRLEIDGKRTKEQGLELRKNRELNHKELSLFLTSVDTGHFRLSIMRYYCKYRKMWIEVEE